MNMLATQTLQTPENLDTVLLAPIQIAPSVPQSIVFIDSRVDDAVTLLNDLPANTQVVTLDSQTDGLTQMADWLAAHPGAAAVSILAHGSAGNLWLGKSFLDADTLTSHAADLERIGTAMATGGDLLVYACDLAANAQGVAFVGQLAQLAGVDVAASNDRTGTGGDWQLEITTGHIEAAPFMQQAQGQYTHSLATLTVTNNNDSGAGSLRQAIADALAGDTITFNAGMSIALSSGQLAIAKNLTIDGDLDNDGTADVILDAGYHSRVLQISTGTVLLDGLVIEHGLLAGNGGNGGQAGGSALGAGIHNAGTLTILHSSISNNVATGGGGGGTDLGGDFGGGGGGGGGFSGVGGGNGGSFAGMGAPGSAGKGGGGGGGGAYGGYSAVGSTGGMYGGNGGTSVGGGNGGSVGGKGGSVSGTGGGGGGGHTAGSLGGSAAGGIYNAGTLNIASTIFTGNEAVVVVVVRVVRVVTQRAPSGMPARSTTAPPRLRRTKPVVDLPEMAADRLPAMQRCMARPLPARTGAFP